ncbi:twin-arginine translocation signal domain-containing protein, partial [Duganella vulcania]
MTTRRSFLKIGAAGALLLAAGGAAYRLTHPPAAPTAFVLDGEAGAVLAAIVPAMLGPVLPARSFDRYSVSMR